jgi:hypothetical protein
MKKKLLALAALAVGATTSAFAALPASVTTTVTGIGSDGQSLFDAVFPIIGILIGLVVTIKLFKRFVAKI